MPEKPAPKPTEAERASDKYMKTTDKWADDVFYLNSRGKLDKVVGKGYSPLPFDFVGDTLWNLRKKGFGKGTPTSEEANVVEGGKKVLFDDVYDKARSTFTEGLVDQLKAINPKPSDDASQQLRYAINFKLVNNLADRLRRKYEIDYAGKGNGVLDKGAVDALIDNIASSPDFRNYTAFLEQKYNQPNTKVKPSDFSPFVYARPTLEAFLSNRLPNDANVAKHVGTSDIPVWEMGMQGPTLDTDSKIEDYYNKRSNEVQTMFNMWKQKAKR